MSLFDEVRAKHQELQRETALYKLMTAEQQAEIDPHIKQLEAEYEELRAQAEQERAKWHNRYRGSYQ